MRKLEIGSQTKLGPDWELMDIRPGPDVDVVADLAEPLPFEDGAFGLIYMSHVLEHVPWFQTVDVLREVRRILKTGGTVEIWVPDFGKIVDAYLSGTIPDDWRRCNPDGDPMLWCLGRLFGVGGYAQNWHRAGFDEPHLENCLMQAGFREPFRLDVPRGVAHGVVNLGLGARK